MDTSVASEAARRLSQQRWGNRKVIRVARELSVRADELPDDERQALRKALDEVAEVRK
jgi:hypothetical protein